MTAAALDPATRPSANNTALVIVTYEPDAEFPQRLRIAAAQFPLTVLVDNTAAESPGLPGTDADKLRVLRNHGNPGLGIALNQGCEAALDSGFEWVVTLDQDSLLAPEFLQGMLLAWHQCGDAPAILGSNYFSVSRDAYKIAPGQGASTVAAKTVITSGSLVHLGTWNGLGRFREDYFIDAIDHEFCLRLRGAGFPVRISCQSLMRHTIGDELSYSGWLRRLAPFSHSPLRKYTTARNSLRTMLEYGRQEPLWCIRKVFGATLINF